MATSKLRVKRRVRIGKTGSKKVRNEGKIPAILYGNKLEPIPLIINPVELKKALDTEAGRNTLIELEIEDEDKATSRLSILRDIQIDHLTSKAIHLDFQAVDREQTIDISIPIVFTGRSEGVKEGGILEETIRVLEAKCPASEIPNELEVDISALLIGDSIHVRDLELPENVIPLRDEDETVVSVQTPKGMEIEEEVEVGEEEEIEGEEEEVEGEEEEEEKEQESSES